MKLLGAILYDPSSSVAVGSAASVLAIFDTTNARLSVTVPSHGMVRVRIAVTIHGAATYSQITLGVLEGATVRGRVVPVVSQNGTALATTMLRAVAEYCITGLSPGTVNWDAAWGIEQFVSSSQIKYGGANNTVANDGFGALQFEVWDPAPQPTNYGLLSIDANGRMDVIKVAGTTQTARDLGASVLLSTGTGTGQLDFTSGVVKANAVQLLGTAWLTPAVAGTPDVNAKQHGGTAQTGRDIGASVLLSTGTGTGQLDFTSGVVKANATQWLGGTIPAVNVTGVPIIDAKYLLGTVFPTPTVAGIPNVNAKTWNDLATVALPLVPATAGRTLVVDAAGLADANAVKMGPTGAGTAQTARDIGASVLLSTGTGTGQLDFTSGVVKSNLAQILGTALTETAGQIAAAFKKFFNIATPAATMDHGILVDTVTTYTGNTPQTGDNFARLGAPAGASVSADIAANKALLPAALVGGRMDSSVGAMAANVLTAAAINADAITDAKVASDVTIASVTGAVGSVTGAVGSVTGAVGSVTGNVGGNVAGSVASVTAGVTVTTNNDKTGYSLSAAAVQAIWDALTSALTTVGSIGKKLADWTIGTAQTGDSYARIGAAGAGLTALGDTRIANLDATVSSRSTYAGGAVASVTADVGITQVGADKVWGSAARTLTGFGTLAADVWASATRLLTGGTNIVLAKGTGITGFNDIAAGAAMTLTTGERTAVANEVEAQIIDDTDSEKVLTAITDKIAAVNPDLGGLTVAAIATATAAQVTADHGAGSYARNTEPLDAAGVRAALGVASANLDTQLDALPTSAELATAVGVAQSGDSFARVGAAGAGLTALGDARLVHLDADVSSRSTFAGGAVASVTGAVGSVTGLTASDVGAIKAKTDSLPDDPADESLIIAAANAVRADIAALNNLSSAQLAAAIAAGDDATLAAIGALNNLSAADVLRSALTEGYAVDGAPMTVEQALHMVWSMLSDKAIVGTTLTTRKLDGSTAAMTFALDSGTLPTSQARAT